jgi:hypothetical protein
MNELPTVFCWTRFGSEAGQSAEAIFKRKELERQANLGIFLWGIGTSVGPSLALLLKEDLCPRVVFSPMRTKAKTVDAAPKRVFAWTQAIALGGVPWPLPSGTLITSRADAERTGQKRQHYALVCRAMVPLGSGTAPLNLSITALRNLASGAALGASQVTSIVRSVGSHGDGDYEVAVVADLVYPFFVKLVDPVLIQGDDFDAIRMVNQLATTSVESWILACKQIREKPTINGQVRRRGIGQVPLFAGRTGT